MSLVGVEAALSHLWPCISSDIRLIKTGHVLAWLDNMTNKKSEQLRIALIAAK
jgi:hypothetical protein